MSAPLDNNFLDVLSDDVDRARPLQLPVPESSPASVYRPPPPPEPLLPDNRPLCREARQPERLEVIRAAASPLIEAARPLLDALVNLPQTPLDAAQITALHAELAHEIATFQSVCGEARLPEADIIMASYALCAALDEAACMAPWGVAIGEEAGTWAARLLAVQFHGDAEGGLKVFKMLGVVFARARAHIDVLDLLHRILETGFMGVYRRTLRGPRVLEDIRRQVEDKVMTVRRMEAEEAEWERANCPPATDTKPSPRAPRIEMPEWAGFVLLETVPLALLAAAAVWWFFFRNASSS